MEDNSKFAKLFSLFFLSILSLQAIPNNQNFLPPHPGGGLILNVLQQPSFPSLSLSLIPSQVAIVNHEFKLNLKQFVEATLSELSYRFMNGFYNWNDAKNTVGNFLSVDSLPLGVMQANIESGDCFPEIRIGPAQGCNIHFYVDTKIYNPNLSENGPAITMLLNWTWGSHNYLMSESHLIRPKVSERMMDIISPVLLPIELTVNPQFQDGLRYDKDRFSITGIPERIGLYQFTVKASNGKSITESRVFSINVKADLKDKPVLKTNYSLASAVPEKEYKANLMELLESVQGFGINNQIRFHLSGDKPYPNWLSIDEDAPIYLKGTVPLSAAGQMIELNLTATSNTGGESQKGTVFLPVTYDISSTPFWDNNIQLTGKPGGILTHDFRLNIHNPSEQASLKIIIDKIVPQTPHLNLILSNLTEINASIPEEAVGQTYFITLHANTALGGNSDQKIIPVNIETDNSKTPSLDQNLQMPLLNPGLAFEYDFQAHQVIAPDYKDYPFTIRFSEGHYKPKWLRLENNKLVADKVPFNINKTQKIHIKIKNIPGGVSKDFLLILHSTLE